MIVRNIYMQEQIIIGLSGEMGSGKGTVAQYLSHKYGAVSFRFSDVLRDILDRARIEKTRENIAASSRMLRETFGQDILSKIVFQDIERSRHKVVLVDGIRRESDMRYLRGLDNFVLLYIEVNLEKRYERIKRRSENAGDKTKTFEEFKKEQELETESTIAPLRTGADFIINNDGVVEELYIKVDELFAQLQK